MQEDEEKLPQIDTTMPTAMIEKVSIDVATKDVHSWLDHKKIKPYNRERLKPFVDIMIDAVCYGQLSLKSDFKWLLKLDFPVGESKQVTELEFVPRINDVGLEPYKRGVKGSDASDTANLVMLCALTKTALNYIKQLDTTDRQVADAIQIFFQ